MQRDEIRAERVAANEAAFRALNERIEDRALQEVGPQHVDFLCECWDPSCAAPLTLTIHEYEHARSHAEWAAVLPEHVKPNLERVVEWHERHWIVEKTGRGAEVYRDLDPRGDK